MARHDSQRTAYQATGVDIDTPGVLQTIHLGGALRGGSWLIGDADGDGDDEVYLLGGGRLMSWRGDGVLRWASPPLGLTHLLALDDLDGDGRQEVFAYGTRIAPIAFDALTGEELWQAPTPSGQYVGDVRPVDIDGDGQRELIIADWAGPTGGHGTARVYSFPDGLRGAVAGREVDASAHGYWFGLGLDTGDLAGDGRIELVTASNDRIVAYDLATGTPAFTSASLGAFPYGEVTLNVADIDGDGRDEVVVASNNAGGSLPGAKRLMVMEVEGGALVLRWELVVDPLAGVHRFIQGNVAQLAADGSQSIVTSVFSPTVGHWRTLVFAGTSPTATPMVTLEDRVVLALSDVDGDGVSELLTLDVPGANVPAFGRVRALSLQTDLTWTETWSALDARLAIGRGAWSSSPAQPIRADRGVVLDLDIDGDQRADHIGYAGGDPATFAAPLGVTIADVRARPDIGRPDHVWIAMTDGRIARLDRGFRLVNDAVLTDGLADLVVGNYRAPATVTANSSSGMLLATIDPAGAPAVYLPASGLEPLWTGLDRVATPRPFLTWLPGDSPRLAFAAREANGTLSLVIRDGLTGAERARYSYGPAVLNFVHDDLMPLRGPDGNVSIIVASLYDSVSGQLRHTAIAPLTGSPIALDLTRELIGRDYSATAHDVDGDGFEDAMVVQRGRLVVVSGVDGSRVLEHANPRGGGMMSYLDLDGDGGLDVLHQGGALRGAGFGARRLSADLSSEIWSIEQMNRHNPLGLARALDGSFRLGLTRQREAWFRVLDAAGGEVATWTPAGGSRYPDLASAMAAGERPEAVTAAAGVAAATSGRSASFFFGSTDGYLYSARAEDGALTWALPFRTAVGEPIASDVTGDGHSEIIVPAGDGNIYIVGPARLAAPSGIFDNDGSTRAGSPAGDVDELVSSNRAGGDWTEVLGATGYEYEIVRDDDLVVVPWTDVGASTEAFFDTVSLQVGPRYFGVVRAYDRAGAEARVSPEARSDGFVVVDSESPEVEISATPQTIWRAGDGTPTETQIHMVARDAVALMSYAIRVELADGGASVATLAAGPASGTERIVDVRWRGLDDMGRPVPAGRFTVVGMTTDAAGNAVEARAEVRVCTLVAPVELGCLESADAGVGDEGTLAGGGGCGCRVTSEPSVNSATLILLIGVGLVLARRRRA